MIIIIIIIIIIINRSNKNTSQLTGVDLTAETCKNLNIHLVFRVIKSIKLREQEKKSEWGEL